MADKFSYSLKQTGYQKLLLNPTACMIPSKQRLQHMNSVIQNTTIPCYCTLHDRRLGGSRANHISSTALHTTHQHGTPMATPKTMRAEQYDTLYGGGTEGLKHVEVPVPSPKKGEVLLKMEAANMKPINIGS